MNLTPGSRWKRGVCAGESVVVRPPNSAGELQCGGLAMIAFNAERPASRPIADGAAGGCLLGKRYADEASGLEVLCTKAGDGALAFDGRLLVMREAKKLPSSD